ncbi:putative calcium-binding protein CML15 [Hibiscus syriacus]|uniref:Calcium-binding protein CML15 n=1 Tax=Hibiscus syriacus TaxID=106335 RepID=A0A6A2XGY6_HIBSY|nr:putative calcium-binding protein CML15 [Hibiscus syriacus]
MIPLPTWRPTEATQDIFTRFDIDSDGSLTARAGALLRSLGLKPSGDQIHILLADMDANGNGFSGVRRTGERHHAGSHAPDLINQAQLSVVCKAFDRDGKGISRRLSLREPWLSWAIR